VRPDELPSAIVSVPAIDSDRGLSAEDLRRLYGERTCIWPECDYVAVGEYELGLHADEAHGLKAPEFLRPEPEADPVLDSLAALHRRLDEVEPQLRAIAGVLERFTAVLDKLERSPWGRVLR
jgi:hypothetical protein